jgi:peptidoglycan hydrolase CwlO-like protein
MAKSSQEKIKEFRGQISELKKKPKLHAAKIKALEVKIEVLKNMRY